MFCTNYNAREPMELLLQLCLLRCVVGAAQVYGADTRLLLGVVARICNFACTS